MCNKKKASKLHFKPLQFRQFCIHRFLNPLIELQILRACEKSGFKKIYYYPKGTYDEFCVVIPNIRIYPYFVFKGLRAKTTKIPKIAQKCFFSLIRGRNEQKIEKNTFLVNFDFSIKSKNHKNSKNRSKMLFFTYQRSE